MMPCLVSLDGHTFDPVIAAHGGVVVVEFWARWCRPCRAMAPLIARVATERRDVLVAKVDVDRAGRLAARYGVHAVPTLMRFDGGRPTASTVGVLAYDRLLAALGLDREPEPARGDLRAA